MKTLLKLAAATCLATAMAGPARAAEMTGVTGGGQSFSNYQPSLVLNSYVVTQGIFPTRDGPSGGDGLAIPGLLGSIRTFAWNRQLPGLAIGSSLNIMQNTALFSLLSTQYGGNGNSNFLLPNLTGAAMVGDASLSFSSGSRPLTGSANVTLTDGQMPAHAHGLTEGGQGAGVTGPAGGAAAFDNRQPSLEVSYGIATQGLFNGRDSEALIGEVSAFATPFVPGGYLAADGQLLNIRNYAALFAKIGNTYGGDGRTTFALPNLNNRSIVGAGSGPGLESVGLGQVFGEASTTLTTANLPSHAHDVAGPRDAAATGSGQPFSQAQPSLGLRYLIAVNGIFPDFQRNPNFDGTYLGEIIAYAGVSAGPFEDAGFVEAAGQILSVSGNEALYALLGNTYGGTAGVTFALPDLRGRTIVGAGTANGRSYAVGEQLGSNTTRLSVANLPSHSHALPDVAVTAPVPEPATWGMMLIGFAAAGAGLRRRRTTVRYAA